MTIRTTIYLDKTLLKRVHQHIDPLELSQLVSELLAEHVNQLEQSKVEARMREGYEANRQDREELNHDWQIVDWADWPA